MNLRVFFVFEEKRVKARTAARCRAREAAGMPDVSKGLHGGG